MEFSKQLLSMYTVFITHCLITYSKSEKVQCKFPATWQSKLFFDLGAMIGIPGQINGSGTYYYDYPNKQMRLDLQGRDFGNVPFLHTAIWHFNESLVYVMDNDNRKCSRENYDHEVWRQWDGVPDDAALSSYGMIVNIQSMQYSMVRDEADYPIVITLDIIDRDLCTPVRMTIQDQNLDPISGMFVHYEFFDHTELQNPKVFIPPPQCVNPSLEQSTSSSFMIKRLFPRHPTGLFMDN